RPRGGGDADRGRRAVRRPIAGGRDRGARRGRHAGPLRRAARGARGADRDLPHARRDVMRDATRVPGLGLLPDSATVSHGRLALGGIDADELAARFGTPLYVYDATTLRARAAAYCEPLAAVGGRAMFALKANGTPGVLRILREAGLGADVASAGEIAQARAAGFAGADLVVHGNAKGDDDLAASLAAGAGLVVLDAPEEAAALAALA